MRCLAFWAWLILLSMMISSSNHFFANDIISFSLCLSNIPWCVCVYIYICRYVYINIHIYIYICKIFFLHSSDVGHLSFSHSLAIGNTAAIARVCRYLSCILIILLQIYTQG
jgi:hypothetical protein